MLIFAFSWCYVFLSVNYVSKVVYHPFVVAFVVRPIMCSVISVSWCLSTLLSLLFLSMLLTFNSPQLLFLKQFVI